MQIKLYLVNGSGYDFEMSPREFSYRIIGDDWGPPPRTWSLSFVDNDGKEFSLGIDPRDDKPDFGVLAIYDDETPGDDPASITSKQEWTARAVSGKLDDIRELLPEIHPYQRAAFKASLRDLAALLDTERS